MGGGGDIEGVARYLVDCISETLARQSLYSLVISREC